MNTKRDLALDPLTHDLNMIDGSFIFVEGLDYIKQKLRICLLHIYGEWFLDTEKGVKYQDVVWVKNPVMSDINALLKATILDVDGVLEILSWYSSLDNSTRRLSVRFSVNTTDGVINDFEEVL
jgi:hypothetical protein